MTQIDMAVAIHDTECERYGIRWETEKVSERHGPNDSDKAICNSHAQIAVMTDVALFHASFPTYILVMSDGTSMRVSCQRVARKFTGKDIPGNRRGVIDHILGIRAKGHSPQPRHGLPDGTWYGGTDQNTYIAEYAAQLIDSGVDGGIALNIAKRLPW